MFLYSKLKIVVMNGKYSVSLYHILIVYNVFTMFYIQNYYLYT